MVSVSRSQRLDRAAARQRIRGRATRRVVCAPSCPDAQLLQVRHGRVGAQVACRRDLGHTQAWLTHPRLRRSCSPRRRRSDGRLIGACDVTIERESEGDLGYILAREAWGQGYASEVAAALVQAGFEQLKLKRIFAICDVNNYGSIRVLEKAGLRREVMLENYKEAKGRWWNVYFYALTHSNWLALRESENHRLPNSI